MTFAWHAAEIPKALTCGGVVGAAITMSAAASGKARPGGSSVTTNGATIVNCERHRCRNLS